MEFRRRSCQAAGDGRDEVGENIIDCGGKLLAVGFGQLVCARKGFWSAPAGPEEGDRAGMGLLEGDLAAG